MTTCQSVECFERGKLKTSTQGVCVHLDFMLLGLGLLLVLTVVAMVKREG